MDVAAGRLREQLLRFASEPTPDLTATTDALREALLALGSETPDNLAAVARVEAGLLIDEEAPGLGLRLTASGLALSTVLNMLESSQMPADLAESLPQLTQSDYAAVLRVAVLVLSAFENAGSGVTGR